MNSWILSASEAKWANDSVGLSVNYSNPQDGISLQHPATQSSFSLFGITPAAIDRLPVPVPGSLTNCGSTLRATYPASDDFPVETQIACSVLDFGSAIVGLDVIVSVGTEELDVCPQLDLCSRVAEASDLESIRDAGEGAEVQASCALLRLRKAPLTYAEMALPAEFHRTETAEAPETAGTCIRHQLFVCSLEKGVVLRARLRGLLLSQEADEVAVGACYEAFVGAPLPLGR